MDLARGVCVIDVNHSSFQWNVFDQGRNIDGGDMVFLEKFDNFPLVHFIA